MINGVTQKSCKNIIIILDVTIVNRAKYNTFLHEFCILYPATATILIYPYLHIKLGHFKL